MATPEQRMRSASVAALTRWSREPDRKAVTEPARRGRMARFEAEVDPEGKLDPVDRARRAQMLLTAHMRQLAIKSANTRRARASGKRGAA